MIPTFINDSGRGRIFQGDAAACLEAQPDGCAGLCVTSPPYYDSTPYPAPDAYVSWMSDCLRPLRRVLHPDGMLWLVVGGVLVPDMVVAALQGDGWCLIHRCLWVVAGPLETTMRHDHILVFARSLAVLDAPVALPPMRAPEPKPQVQTERGEWFPPLPRIIPHTALGCCSAPGFVVDPFMGHGTTLLGAQSEKRAYMGIDVSARMCDAVALRLAYAGNERWAFCAPSPRGFVPMSHRPKENCRVCYGRGWDGAVQRFRTEGRNGTASCFAEQGYKPCHKCYPGEEEWIRPEVVWKEETGYA